jgi:hypothetical protein
MIIAVVCVCGALVDIEAVAVTNLVPFVTDALKAAHLVVAVGI